MSVLSHSRWWNHPEPPVLIGEDNPYGGRPEYALYPLPENSAGHRLAFKVLGAPTRQHYLRLFLRYNLCTRKWNAREAQRRANGIRLLHWRSPKILLGAKVCGAFDLAYEPFAQNWFPTVTGEGPILILPHPSGRCRIWNDPGSYAKAQKGLREVLA